MGQSEEDVTKAVTKTRRNGPRHMTTRETFRARSGHLIGFAEADGDLV